jgi:molybdopterin converting factor small subunit
MDRTNPLGLNTLRACHPLFGQRYALRQPLCSGKYNPRLDAALPRSQAWWTVKRQYTGIRFRIIDEHDRIRRHIRIFVNGEQARDLSQPLSAADEVVIVQALSGG